MPDYTAQQYSEVLILAQGGVRPEDIAAAMGIPLEQVNAWVTGIELDFAAGHKQEFEGAPVPATIRKRNRQVVNKQDTVPDSVRAKVVELRIQGVSQVRIAGALGLNKDLIDRILEAEFLDHTLLDKPGILNYLRQLELERLDILQESYWAGALNGNPSAFDATLRIMKRRAEMLGLDAPRWAATKTVKTVRKNNRQLTASNLEGVLSRLDSSKLDRLLKAAEIHQTLKEKGGVLAPARGAQGVGERGLDIPTTKGKVKSRETLLDLRKSGVQLLDDEEGVEVEVLEEEEEEEMEETNTLVAIGRGVL